MFVFGFMLFLFSFVHVADLVNRVHRAGPPDRPGDVPAPDARDDADRLEVAVEVDGDLVIVALGPVDLLWDALARDHLPLVLVEADHGLEAGAASEAAAVHPEDLLAFLDEPALLQALDSPVELLVAEREENSESMRVGVHAVDLPVPVHRAGVLGCIPLISYIKPQPQ